jgi:hypothetical protein
MLHVPRRMDFGRELRAAEIYVAEARTRDLLARIP